MTAPVVLEGRGLHGGRFAKVTLVRAPEDDPVTLRQGETVARVDELFAAAVVRATTVASADDRIRVATVEHLFAALAGLGVHRGLSIAIEGDELPLLDGAAAEWMRAVQSLGTAPSPPRLVVRRDAQLTVDRSTYAFALAADGECRVSVAFETGDARLAKDAAWSGTPADFARIAPARTFCFAHELGDLAARGLISHVAPASVVVVAPDAIHSAGAPFSADEPARHKLLDVMGDLYLYGGPPIGTVRATRPGHAATHAAVARALAAGIVTRA
jgi:UDP-3-O-[3-hydroxymyristoyl] N-acetylglucosamine deacetylase